MDEIVREFLVESFENLDQLDQDLVALEGTPNSRELLARVFRTIHTIKGTCGFLAFGRLESLTHVGESLLSELRDGRRAMDEPSTDVLLRMVGTVREILASIEESGEEGDTAVDGVIQAIRAVLEDPLTRGTPEAHTRASDEADGAKRPADTSGSRNASDSSIRVEVDVLDALMRQVGELVLARNQIARFAGDQLDPDLVRASQQLSLIASALQAGVMKARMQPIGHLWAKMPLIVRTLAATSGCQVHLEVVGGDTELDRAMLEAVKDPLMHLVRNAIGHGIEAVQTRVAAGKPANGALTLRAYHAGGQVVVEVVDDGKGIDVVAVAARAVELGLRTPDQIAAMGEPELMQLLFRPGFSMADALTNVSGRGVGMDVVHTRIAALGGVVEVESAVGAGTTWRLRIPLTLAIIPALLVESAGEVYAIPQVSLLELVAPQGRKASTQIEYVSGAPVLRLRGRLLPLVALRDVLGLPGTPESGAPTVIVVLQADMRRFGLIVDRVMDTEEIVVKPLTARLSGVGIYSGATLLGDGRVGLILDLQAIARRSLTGRSAEADLEPSAPPSLPAKAAGQVLVVGVGGGRRVAIPLPAVTRLERLSRDVVEQVGRREVLQYRRATVPLVRLRHLLGGPDPPAGDAKDLDPPELLVVMSSRGARTVAIAVEEILGIVDDDSSRHSQIDGSAGVGPVDSTVLADRVTELLDLRPIVLSGDPSFFDDDDGDTADDDGQHGDRSTGKPSPLVRLSTPRSALRRA